MKGSENINKAYTFKEILLALREELQKNKTLINQLNSLVKVDTESVYYRFGQILKKEETPYTIILSIYEQNKKNQYHKG